MGIVGVASVVRGDDRISEDNIVLEDRKKRLLPRHMHRRGQGSFSFVGNLGQKGST